jgi:DNA-binding NarL/FixJ family response regulator
LTEQIRVVVADDDVPTRIGLHAIISAEPDFEVVAEAATGLEACEMTRAHAPDIVLMDVQMPDLDGIEATRRIVASGRGDDAPRVIVLTTYDIDEYVYRSLQAGASGFLLKRTRPEELVEAIRTVAHGEALPTPATTRALISQWARPAVGEHERWAAVADLTDRELEVLTLVGRGFSNPEIAKELFLSVETVKTHVKHVYMKLGARDRAQLVIAAYETGVVGRGAGR